MKCCALYGDNLAASFVWFPFGCCSSLWLASSSVIFGVTVGAAHNFVALWAGSTLNVVIGRYFFREPIRERLFDGDFPASRPDNVHLLPKEVGGKVAKMHFSLLGAELIVLVGSAAGTMAFLASGGASGSFIDSVEDTPVWRQRQVPWFFLASGGASDSVHRQCGGQYCLATETGTMAFLASGGASDSVFDSGMDIPVWQQRQVPWHRDDDFPQFPGNSRRSPTIEALCEHHGGGEIMD